MKLFSSRSSHAANGGHSARKATALTVAIILIIVMTVGGTVAWLTSQTDTIINSFKPADSGIKVEEKIEQNFKTQIAVKNTGEAVVYVRVALVANMVDGDTIVGEAAVPEFTLSDDWFKGNDGYYYCKAPLTAGDTTANLLASNSKMELAEGMQVTVLAQSLQTEPTSAVEDAWGVTVNSDGMLAK